ncbi:Transglutaminase-like enzyme, putative cysteine protease [Cohaesibacter sp. ES.047]|uniref:transglutaminase family protein n=1 Tax=Cohaesibacter sp. ES.047 TaxID=1798205 RepID=UPI000BB973F9|nr:transglutaminase family protein [Cohaesibacter sp. ES.047]SNY92587.1 Transglutaminase-like enzyme, putative cysteine protease [Cohaesibacter sp. ES.047]
MVRLTIQHDTTYRYKKPVGLSRHRLMVRPRETRDLSLISFDIDVTPQANIGWAHDVAGNSIASVDVSAPSDCLLIKSRAVVDLSAPVWPVFDIAASAINFPFLYSSDELTDLGALSLPQYADPQGQLAAWTEGFVMTRPTDTLSLLKDIANGVFEQITYQARDAEGTQSPIETLNCRSGSCRDFAVLFAEAVRSLGLGARLVSGYLFDPEQSLTGSDREGSSHAWVEVYVPGAGWISFDPTNRAVGSGHLIAVAVGRCISQIAPISGSFQGSNDDFIDMAVKVSVISAA